MTAQEQQTILIIEDDPDMAEIVQSSLEGIGYGFEHAADGKAGLEKARSGSYCLVVLDVNLPGLDGFEVCRGVREKDPLTPILMLTSRKEELDKVLGLELGADDYVVKPFSGRELRARAKALLRRSGLQQEPGAAQYQEISLGKLKIDFTRRKVYVGQEEKTLTALEYDILAFLAKHRGQPFTRQQIVSQVWRYEGKGYDNSVTVLINRIREKIEDDSENPKYILTERGVGYRMAENIAE